MNEIISVIYSKPDKSVVTVTLEKIEDLYTIVKWLNKHTELKLIEVNLSFIFNDYPNVLDFDEYIAKES